MQPDISAVQRFWQDNPLYSGESRHPVGSKAYFEEHRQVVIDDCFGGRFDLKTLPPEQNRDAVLDLGCGPGFWSVELQWACRIGRLVSADLTDRAVELTRQRLEIYGLPGEARQQNAERLDFPDGTFGHVNCQGVVHHTPDTRAAVAEIARVLRPGGSASISVYYRNVLLRHFRAVRWIARLLGRFGARLKGRGREDIFGLPDVDEIVRTYDGSENPIGKSYDRVGFEALLRPHFEVVDIYFHFFPARALPFPVPRILHRVLDRAVPFMIYANVRKR